MKKVTFGQGKMLSSEDLNSRLADFAGGSILAGFRLAMGSSSYLVSLKRLGATTSKLILPSGVKLEETGDVEDVFSIAPNNASANRFDVIYVTYTHAPNASFSYELVQGIAGQPVDILKSENKLALGSIRVRPGQTLQASDLTPQPLGLYLKHAVVLGAGGIAAPISNAGTTALRPAWAVVGMSYFDTTLNKPIWCKTGSVVAPNGTVTTPAVWVDATGATV